MIYFDNAASTPMDAAVISVINESFKKDYANPSAAHILGVEAQNELSWIRCEILSIIGLSSNEYDVVFTSSATESNNLIIRGLKLHAKDECFYSLADHPSIIGPVLSLKDKDIVIRPFTLLQAGDVNLSDLKNSISAHVKLLVLNAVNSQTGVIPSLKNIVETVRGKENAWIHLDASQSIGKINIDFNLLKFDSITITTHKIGGPKGIAALIVKKNSFPRISPLIIGGGQEGGLRSSTISLPLIKGMMCALQIKMKSLGDNFLLVESLAKRLKEGMLQISNKIAFPFADYNHSPYIMAVQIKGIKSDILMRHLEEKNIIISSSSACSSSKKSFNPVLAALGFLENTHQEFLRVSFSSNNTMKEVDIFLKHFEEIYKKISKF